MDTPEEVNYVADKMIGSTLVAPDQSYSDMFYNTGPQGFLCRCVYVMEKLNYEKTISIKIGLDRNKSVPYIMYTNMAGLTPKYVKSSIPN